MDVRTPEMNGIEATRQITAQYPQIEVIALSLEDDPITMQAIQVVGAAAYLSKEHAVEALHAIAQVLTPRTGKASASPASGGRHAMPVREGEGHHAHPNF